MHKQTAFEHYSLLCTLLCASAPARTYKDKIKFRSNRKTNILNALAVCVFAIFFFFFFFLLLADAIKAGPNIYGVLIKFNTRIWIWIIIWVHDDRFGCRANDDFDNDALAELVISIIWHKMNGAKENAK